MPWKHATLRDERYQLVQALLDRREPVGAICARFGISRQTAAKFRRRWLQSGRSGLEDEPRQTRASIALAHVWQRRLFRLRRQLPTWGARKLRVLLQRRFKAAGVPGERTLQRWLAQAQLTRRQSKRRRVRLVSRAEASEALVPNAVWTLDLKGWFRTLDGSKVEPLTVRDLASRFMLWTRPLAPRNEPQVRRVCLKLFRRHGRPGTIRCDQGAPFFGDGPYGFTRLSLWWWRLGIRVEFVSRGRIHNNHHEQMHRVLADEVGVATNLPAQVRALERWRRRYNELRPHDSLGLQTPASLYRVPPPTALGLYTPQYSHAAVTAQVAANGEARVGHWRGTIGRAFAGLHVMFQPAGLGHYHLFFGHLFLGILDLALSSKLVLPPAIVAEVYPPKSEAGGGSAPSLHPPQI